MIEELHTLDYYHYKINKSDEERYNRLINNDLLLLGTIVKNPTKTISILPSILPSVVYKDIVRDNITNLKRTKVKDLPVTEYIDPIGSKFK